MGRPGVSGTDSGKLQEVWGTPRKEKSELGRAVEGKVTRWGSERKKRVDKT